MDYQQELKDGEQSGWMGINPLPIPPKYMRKAQPQEMINISELSGEEKAKLFKHLKDKHPSIAQQLVEAKPILQAFAGAYITLESKYCEDVL